MTTVDPATRTKDSHPAPYVSNYPNTPEQLRLAARAVVRWACNTRDPEGAVIVAAALGLTP